MKRRPLTPSTCSIVAVLTLSAAGILAGAPARAQVPGEVHHIHGLAVDRQDPEIVLVATHTGLVRLRPKAAPEWIGEHRFDLMGFTAHPTEPSRVYASGHPDMQTYAREKVGNLGLLVSSDGGRTWESVALKGRADFHALTFSPRDGGQLLGWSVAGQPGLYRISTRTWETERLPAQGLSKVWALSASPDAVGPLLAGTNAGLRASRDGGSTWGPVDGIPAGVPVTAVNYHASDPRRVYAYVHQPGGGLMRSLDGGATWTSTGLYTGAETPAVALSVGPGEHVVVATTGADISRSRDGGRTWEKILERGRGVREPR